MAAAMGKEECVEVLAFRALVSFQKTAWGLWFSAVQPSRPLLLLKAVLQCRALRSGKSRVLPASGNSPPSPSLHQLPQAVLMIVGQAHPRISQMPGLFPAQRSCEGSTPGAGGRRSTVLLLHGAPWSQAQGPGAGAQEEREGLHLPALAACLAGCGQ